MAAFFASGASQSGEAPSPGPKRPTPDRDGIPGFEAP